MRKLSKSYAKGGSLEAHGIKVGDTFIKTVSGAIQKVKDKNGNIVFIDLSNGYRDSQPPLPFEMGGYTDFSKSKPQVLNESKMLEYDVEVPEIDIEKIRTIDLNIDNNKILSLDDSIRVLKQIYDKASINAYEEVKILFLDNSNKVIGIYNHSKGGITGTVIDVEMVCALALKCLAKGVIMSHNHPSGSLRFSDADIKVSKELKNALNLFRIALLDSIVITENGFTSMTNEGIFANGGSLSRFDNGGLIRSLISGTSGRSVVELPHSKYKIIKEVTNAQTNGKNNITYMNIVLPKGSIVNNLRGGVFVANEKLKKEYPTIYNEKYGLRITTKEETLKEIYKNSEILEYADGGDLGIEEEIDLTDDNRLRVKELTYEYKKPTSKELAEKHNSGAYEFMEQDKMMSGGKTTFNEKSNAIAKRFEGKRVEPKYQKEYGKVYSKDEAKEVGNKITGSMVSKEKMMAGGEVKLSDLKVESGMGAGKKTWEVSYPKIEGKGVYFQNEYTKDEAKKHWLENVAKNYRFNNGGKIKKGNGEAMQLAKKIRKDGEKWTDAVKRAWLQLR